MLWTWKRIVGLSGELTNGLARDGMNEINIVGPASPMSRKDNNTIRRLSGEFATNDNSRDDNNIRREKRGFAIQFGGEWRA